MDLGDRIKHTAEVAKWKANQQKRLMQINSSVSELKSEIRKRKAALAERVLSLHEGGHLSEDDLNVLCAEIVVMRKKVAKNNKLHKQIKEESPPEQPQSAEKTFRQQSEDISGNEASFKCPSCDRVILEEAIFCTHCGEPILASQKKESEESLNLCPNCEANIPSDAGFCPECGNQIPENSFSK